MQPGDLKQPFTSDDRERGVEEAKEKTTKTWFVLSLKKVKVERCKKQIRRAHGMLLHSQGPRFDVGGNPAGGLSDDDDNDWL